MMISTLYISTVERSLVPVAQSMITCIFHLSILRIIRIGSGVCRFSPVLRTIVPKCLPSPADPCIEER